MKNLPLVEHGVCGEKVLQKLPLGLPRVENVIRMWPQKQVLRLGQLYPPHLDNGCRAAARWRTQQITMFLSDISIKRPVLAAVISLLLIVFGVIAFIGLYYLFKDGERLVKALIRISPLPDKQDAKIIDRLARSVRSVLAGSLAVGLIQGTLTAIGFTIFGVPQAILWGMVAAIAALIPAVGTSLVFIPTIAFLVIAESYGSAAGVAAWGVVIVGLVDNFLGPWLVARGATLHSFLVLVSALGGLAVFGPVGFVLGPVIMSFMIALLEVYESHIISTNKK